MNNEKEPSVNRLRVVFWDLQFLESGTEMSDRDSKILVEFREVVENKNTTLCKTQGVVVFYLLDQVLFIKRSKIG